MTTMERINELSAERSRLYRLVDGDRRGDSAVRNRTQEIGREIDALWAERRQERAGQPEGIDLIIDRAYQRIYGPDYDNVVAPQGVDAIQDLKTGVAA